MADAIEFYFDFSSPYAYLAAQQIDEIGSRHRCKVTWKPFLLGAVFKTTGGRPLPNVPLKGDYLRTDLPRSARLLGVPLVLPEPFPFMSVAACRAVYWLADRDPDQAKRLAKRLFHAAFGEGRSIAAAEAVVEIASELGIDRTALADALRNLAVKQRLRDEVDAAIAKGVCGAPFIFVDGEPFWGQDRLDQVDLWLARGGW